MVGYLALAGFLNPLILILLVNVAGQALFPLSLEHHSLAVKVLYTVEPDAATRPVGKVIVSPVFPSVPLRIEVTRA